MAYNAAHSRFPHVYGIVRIDLPFDETNPKNRISLVKVSRSEAVAEAEAERLNQVNADKNCTYVCCISRLID